MSYGIQKATEIAFELQTKFLPISEFQTLVGFKGLKKTRDLTGVSTDLTAPGSSSDAKKTDDRLQVCLKRIDLRNRYSHQKVKKKDLVEALQAVIQKSHDQGNLLRTSELGSTLLVQVTLGTFTILLDSLFNQTYAIRDEIDYWLDLENDRFNSAIYLFQTLPRRILDVLTGLKPPEAESHPDDCDRGMNLDKNAISDKNVSSKPQSRTKILSENFRRRFLAHQRGLFITRLFPHFASTISFLKTNRLRDFSSTLSPLLLIKQESRLKLKLLEESYEEYVEKIGYLISTLNHLESQVKGVDGLSESPTLQFSELIDCMAQVAGLDYEENEEPLLKAGEGIDDRGFRLHRILIEGLDHQERFFKKRISEVSRPQFLSRNWPWLVLSPALIFTTAKLSFAYSKSAIDFVRDFRATVKGFVVGWVIRPIEDILNTLRAGGSGNLAIMSKDSLESELHSLERMTVDFGRDKYKWDEEELTQVAQKVREGDLTAVLKVWEQEIKSPIRSALLGSLIRVLLIQVQKVKVDLSVAMDGIQSMLRSQSLTIAAIGVAPSMLICFTLGKLFNSLLKRRAGVVGKGTRAVRADVRMAIRRIERSLILISSNPNGDHHSITRSHNQNPNRTIGNLFLDLNLLRNFGLSNHFPIKQSSSQTRNEFLNDVKDLEDLNVSWITKRKLSKRFTRQWGFLVGLV